METWKPISEQDLAALIERDLAECTPEARALFSRFRVSLRPAAINRGDRVESVYVVAQNGRSVIYYEDVEEGFNISALSTDGAIEEPGFEQWELRHALFHWAKRVGV